MSAGRSKPLDSDKLIVQGVGFSHLDIETVVSKFYRKVEVDEDLKIPFQSVHDWPEHIVRLTHFWWLRFGGKPYMMSVYNPVQKHFFAGFSKPLLEKWLGLFRETLKENLTSEQCQVWSDMAGRMGHALSIKNEMFKEYYEEKQKQSGPTE